MLDIHVDAIGEPGATAKAHRDYVVWRLPVRELWTMAESVVDADRVVCEPSEGSAIMSPVNEWVDAPLCEPVRNVLRIEAEQVAPFHVWDASLGNQPSHMPDAHSEVIGDLMDVQQPRQLD